MYFYMSKHNNYRKGALMGTHYYYEGFLPFSFRL